MTGAMLDRLKYFVTPFDRRYEDMNRGNWYKIAFRDVSAGLIVAMMAIPMAMGFAMASGLRPEHGIVAGAVAGMVGALFGGSKYNVYGPVAALIPVIADIMASYATPADPFAGHSYLVLICVASAPFLLAVGMLGWGRIGNLVPHSVVVGFSVGIAVTIAVTQLGEVLGLKGAVSGSFVHRVELLWQHAHEFKWAALLIAGITFAIIRLLLMVSIYIPAPLIAIGVATLLASTVLVDQNLSIIRTKYGEIPTNFLQITPPSMPSWDLAVVGELAYYALAFAFVCGFESILAARMGDRMANNRGTPYNPDKEFWGQGLIQLVVPLLNGMPLSGALARTATNIKAGAVTPLAGIMKCVLKLLMAYFLAHELGMVPMACIGGILLWVASNMVKPAEIREIISHSRFHTFLMTYTALAVIFKGFLFGVLTATLIYAVLHKRLDPPGADPTDPTGGAAKDDGTQPAAAAVHV